MNDIEHARAKRDKRATISVDMGAGDQTVITMTCGGKLAFTGTRGEFFAQLHEWWRIGAIGSRDMAQAMAAIP